MKVKMKIKLMILFVLACGVAHAEGSPESAGASPKVPDVTFNKTKLILAKTQITAEVADTDLRRERGLMNRTKLKDSEGMIFIFSHAEPQAFWMKDTLIPLSIGFFTESGELFQTLDMEPASPVDLNPKTYVSSQPAMYALEVPVGWFKRKKIKIGSQLKIPALHIPDR